MAKRTTSTLKIERLKEKYPFLGQILEMNLEPRADGIGKVDVIGIHIQVADGDLMFHKPNIAGVGDDGFYYQNGKRGSPASIIRQCEYVFAADGEKIINDGMWTRGGKKDQGGEYPYALGILIDTVTSRSIWDRTEYIVSVVVKTFHEDTKIQDARCGKMKKRYVEIIIHTKPEIGFERLCKESLLEDHIYLSERLFSDAVINDDKQLIRLSGRLDELSDTFQRKVYRNGLKASMDKNGNKKVLSWKSGSIEMRCKINDEVIVLEDGRASIRFDLSRYEGRLNLGSVQGRLPAMRELVDGIEKAWNEDPGFRDSYEMTDC